MNSNGILDEESASISHDYDEGNAKRLKLTVNQSENKDEITPSESSILEEKSSGQIIIEPETTSTITMTSTIITANESEDWKMFAEMRAMSREENPGPRDDDWLDDEQWYCENILPMCGEEIILPDELLQVGNCSNLIEFLNRCSRKAALI